MAIQNHDKKLCVGLQEFLQCENCVKKFHIKKSSAKSQIHINILVIY